MDHEKQYEELIEKNRKDPPAGYSERHHVIPRCMGGSDSRENVVRLSARDHFRAH